MLYQKMLGVITDVSNELAERDELVECIAIALLSNRNLFILGDTGQAKSYCIDEFRKRITEAKQFSYQMTKETDEEELFGRIDLSSIIPGNLPNEELIKDVNYSVLYKKLEQLYQDYEVSGKTEQLQEAMKCAAILENLKKTIYTLKGNQPRIKTAGKIPESDIVFLDEFFKANDGILNSLLTAVNERRYTNEGNEMALPVISYLTASNEIPNFDDPEQKILKPLYDRFDLKILTKYVEERQNRLDILKKKQNKQPARTLTTITLEELRQMQQEVALIKIPDTVNELADDILCVLRSKEIHISDRKYFGYASLVQAKAYLRGATEVAYQDLMILKNYFWNTPSQISTIEQLLTQMCQNPIHSKLEEQIAMADEVFDSFEANQGNNRAFIKARNELIKIYKTVLSIEAQAVSQNDKNEVASANQTLEKISKKIYDLKGYPVVPLSIAYEQEAS